MCACLRVRVWALRCRLSQFACSSAHMGLIRKESENDCFTFIVLSLMKMWNVSSATISTLTEPTKQRLCTVSLWAGVRLYVRACVCLSECLILTVKWFYAILIICVNEYEYLLDNCIANAIELSRTWLRKLLNIDFCWALRRLVYVTHEFIHIHKQNVHSLHLKFTNWTKYNIHLMKRIPISTLNEINEFRFRLKQI